MQSYKDFNDILPSLSARGQIIVRPKVDGRTKTEKINGRYFDPVSGRIDELSNDEYYRQPGMIP